MAQCNRRKFLHTASVGAAAGIVGGIGWKGAQARPSQGPMRLDVHTHMFDRLSIDKMRDHAPGQGITHFQAILLEANWQDTLDYLPTSGLEVLPFMNLTFYRHNSNPHFDPRFAGLKWHPRHQDGASVAVTEATVGNIASEAERQGLPVTVHTDANIPFACSLPMLGDIAENHPGTAFIAAHMGVYTAEDYPGTQTSTPENWEPRVEPLFRENFECLLDIPNLYGDTPMFSMDFSSRSSDRDHRLKVFTKVVGSFTPAKRRALLDKLFIGTDFPCMWDPPWGIEGGSKRPESTYGHQLNCIRTVFGDDFDENRTTQTFLNLLPERFGYGVTRLTDPIATRHAQRGFTSEYARGPGISLAFNLPASQVVTFNLLNPAGRMVRTVSEFKHAGRSRLLMRTDGIASGPYICTMHLDNGVTWGNRSIILQ